MTFIESIADIVDIAQWDVRSVEFLRRHPVSLDRFRSWKRVFSDYPDPAKTIESHYLLDIGDEIYENAIEVPRGDAGYLPGQLEQYREARKIFALIVELHGARGSSYDHAIQLLEMLDVRLSVD